MRKRTHSIGMHPCGMHEHNDLLGSPPDSHKTMITLQIGCTRTRKLMLAYQRLQTLTCRAPLPTTIHKRYAQLITRTQTHTLDKRSNQKQTNVLSMQAVHDVEDNAYTRVSLLKQTSTNNLRKVQLSDIHIS